MESERHERDFDGLMAACALIDYAVKARLFPDVEPKPSNLRPRLHVLLSLFRWHYVFVPVACALTIHHWYAEDGRPFNGYAREVYVFGVRVARWTTQVEVPLLLPPKVRPARLRLRRRHRKSSTRA